jgi:RNA recognition motif-containing protein
MLYNIFSNFGNIKKIIFIRRQAAALIEYETVEFAAKAKEDLSNIVFMGKPLRVLNLCFLLLTDISRSITLSILSSISKTRRMERMLLKKSSSELQRPSVSEKQRTFP